MKYQNFEQIRNRMTIWIMYLLAAAMLLAFLFEFLRDPKPIQRFSVIDKYNQCDIVQYTSKTNELYYFLDCNARNTEIKDS